MFVEPYESVNSSFSDLQRGKVREKVITNKETHENPVINGSLDEASGEGGGEEMGTEEATNEESIIQVADTLQCINYMQLTSKSNGKGRPLIRSSLSKYYKINIQELYIYFYMYIHDKQRMNMQKYMVRPG